MRMAREEPKGVSRKRAASRFVSIRPSVSSPAAPPNPSGKMQTSKRLSETSAMGNRASMFHATIRSRLVVRGHHRVRQIQHSCAHGPAAATYAHHTRAECLDLAKHYDCDGHGRRRCRDGRIRWTADLI